MAHQGSAALRGKTCLVCGGAGFMGSNFIRFLLAREPLVRVINLDALTYAGNRENVRGLPAPRHRFVRGDIADAKLVSRLMRGADFVVNFAAETHVDRSIHKDARDFLHSNVLGVHSLLEALRASPRVKKLIQISTDEVWGEVPLSFKRKFNERSPFRPNSPYAASKASGDLLCRAYWKTYGVPVIVSHSVNNFGPRQFPEKLIPFFTLRAMKNEPLPLYGDGKNVRDWLFVDDHSSAILLLLQRGEPGSVYAISRGEEHANIEIARTILGILGKPETLVTFVKDRPAHDRRYSVNSSRLRALGWKPRGSFDERLRDTIRWYLHNKAWVEKVLKKHRNINEHIGLSD
ncbi:MAG: dTDP-glucose 4,6-dehydratase [Patescibacteria group bacterium]